MGLDTKVPQPDSTPGPDLRAADGWLQWPRKPRAPGSLSSADLDALGYQLVSRPRGRAALDRWGRPAASTLWLGLLWSSTGQDVWPSELGQGMATCWHPAVWVSVAHTPQHSLWGSSPDRAAGS